MIGSSVTSARISEYPHPDPGTQHLLRLVDIQAEIQAHAQGQVYQMGRGLGQVVHLGSGATVHRLILHALLGIEICFCGSTVQIGTVLVLALQMERREYMHVGAGGGGGGGSQPRVDLK